MNWRGDSAAMFQQARSWSGFSVGFIAAIVHRGIVSACCRLLSKSFSPDTSFCEMRLLSATAACQIHNACNGYQIGRQVQCRHAGVCCKCTPCAPHDDNGFHWMVHGSAKSCEIPIMAGSHGGQAYFLQSCMSGKALIWLLASSRG